MNTLVTGDSNKELDSFYPLLTDFVEGPSELSKQRVNIIKRRLSDSKLRPNIEELSPNKRIIERNNLLEDRSILLDRSMNVLGITNNRELGSSYPL
jgi:hypothetical protein